MLCPSYNKFASQEADVEMSSELEVSEDGSVTGEVRVVVTSGCCSDELKEANLEIDESVDIKDHEGHSLSVTADDPDLIDEYDNPGRPARYQKHWYGASLSYTVTCDDCKVAVADGDWSDKVPASSMDELV
jgi:hypothetical protein